MRAIIAGKRYDTSTATCVAEDSDGNAGDFRAYSEGLYRTAKGAWFTAGEGGPLSSYAQPGIDGTHGGSAVRVLSADGARQWLEDHGETGALEEYFAGEIEDA